MTNRLSLAEQNTLRAIAWKLLPFGKTADLLPRSQLVELSQLSRSGVKKGLDGLVRRALISREYVCGSCCHSFGQAYEISYIFCPICGQPTAKNIWVKIALLEKGHDAISQLGVPIYTTVDNSATLPYEAKSFLEMVSRLLCITNLNTEKKFSQYLGLHWNEHSYTDWLLALSYCHSKREQLKYFNRVTPIYTLGGLFDWAFAELAKSRENSRREGESYSSLIAEVRSKEQLLFALDLMDSTDKMPFEQAEKQHMYCLQIVDHLYHAFKDLKDVFDRITTDRGYIPQLLQRPKPAPAQPRQEQFKANMLEIRRALKLA